MSFAPISYSLLQYENFPNWWLKAYEQGTTTGLPMAITAAGGSQAAKFELNSEGFPVTAGSVRTVLYVNGSYDLWLFPTAAEADADDTSNAIQMADNVDSDLSNSALLTRNYGTQALLAAAITSADVGNEFTTGEHTAGFGYEGGNRYKVVTVVGGEVFDGGSKVLGTTDTSVYLQGLFPNGVSPKQFGCAGDGSNDDGIAFSSFCQYCSAEKRQGVITTGDYHLDTLVPGVSDLNLIGESRIDSILDFRTGSLDFSDNENITLKNLHLRNDGTDEICLFLGCSNVYVGYNYLSQLGGVTSNTAPFAFADSATQGGSRYTVEHNEFHGSTASAIIFQAASGKEMSEIKIMNNRIYGDNMPTLNECQPIKVDLHCNNFEVAFNYINGEQTPGGNVVIVSAINIEEDLIAGNVHHNIIEYCGGGIRIHDGQGGLRVEDCQIHHNIIRNLFNYGSGIGGALGISITGDGADPHTKLNIHNNTIDGCVEGIQFSDGASVDMDVNDNNVTNATGTAYTIIGDSVRLSRNTARNSGGRGFNISNCDDVTGSGNRSYEATDQSLRISGCHSIRLDNCRFKGTSIKAEEVSISGGTGYHVLSGSISTGASYGVQVYSDADGVGTELEFNDTSGFSIRKANFATTESAVPSMLIVAGVATATSKLMRVIGESSTTDDLDTIEGGQANQILTLKANGSHTVTVKNGTGNIIINGDFAMDNANDRLVLMQDGANNNWYEVSRTEN